MSSDSNIDVGVSAQSPWGFVLHHARPARFALLVAALLYVVQSLALLGVPYVLGEFVFTLFSGVASAPHAFLIAGLLVAQAALGAVARGLSGSGLARIAHEVRSALFTRLMKLPLLFHTRRPLGETAALLASDTDAVSDYVAGVLVQVPAALVRILIAAYLVWLRLPELALAALLSIPVALLLVRIITHALRSLAARSHRRRAESLALAQESVAEIATLRSYGVTEARAEAFFELSEDLRASTVSIRVREAVAVAVLGVLGAGLVLVAYLVLDREGTVPFPVLVEVTVLIGLMLGPARELANLYGRTQVAKAACARLAPVVDAPADSELAPSSSSISKLSARGVDFSYPGAEPVLRAVHLGISPGEIIALTGPNGCGKSTLGLVLAGLLPPASGEVMLDGGETSMAELRAHVALVTQSAVVLRGTLRFNLTLGKDIGRTALEEVLELVGLERFAKERGGLDAELSERAASVSGGQAQRIALARALLTNRPVLLMDEATAQLDVEGEAEILDRLRSDARAIIIISHRPEVIAKADRCLRLESGRLTSV